MFTYSGPGTNVKPFDNASELIRFMKQQRSKINEILLLTDYFDANQINYTVECHVNNIANIFIVADLEHITVEVSEYEFSKLHQLSIHVLHFYGTINFLLPLITPKLKRLYVHRLEMDYPELVKDLAKALNECPKLSCLSITKELVSQMRWSGLYVLIGNASPQFLQLIPKHVEILELSGFDILPQLVKLLPTFTQIKRVSVLTIDILSPPDALQIQELKKSINLEFTLNNQLL